MGDEGTADDEDVYERLRAAHAAIPALMATHKDGWFDPDRLAEWLALIGEAVVDPSADGDEPPGLS